jgi:hypothetical protein
VLSLVPSPSRARRAPFVALLLGILLAGLLGLLLLNTASAQDAFRLHRLQASAAAAADERQALSDQVNRLTGPAALAARAQQLGMIPGGPPEFWKPGQPLPPGARVVDGLVVLGPPGGAPPPRPVPQASQAPTNPADPAVTTVQRPLGGGGTQAAPTARPRPTPSAKPSTQHPTGPTDRPTAQSTGGSGSQPKPTSTKPSTTTSTTGRARAGSTGG